ncbi:DUF692 domain-containing protein [Sorangium cellulosum]|uniref:Uncharacterized protein n=1 Tax=Sorangium cellulosum TaxID=56 RepID=A0A150QAY0_SORCE|nr:DUF692 domain-containing protein [Sorangium cellulosum]KYF65083.1 hypothetical protein BE15_02260 [Sorangium cellulosum]
MCRKPRFDLPRLGVGLAHRPAFVSGIEQHRDRIDWIEFCADHYICRTDGRFKRALELSESMPVAPHGLELSVGTDAPLDMDYCGHVAHLAKAVRAPWYSDHLCFTQADGVELGQLTPLAFTEAAVRRCAEKARQFQDMLGVPLLLENITYYMAIPGATMTEAEFLSAVVTEADCGILLDLTNLYINAQNLHYDPYAFIDAIPLDRVVQVHLAGGVFDEDLWVDTHSHPIDNHPEVWRLLSYLCERAPVRAVLIERDANPPEDFGEMLGELDRARAILA